MARYRGETYSLLLNESGFCHNKNTDIIAPAEMVHPSRNVWLNEGGIRKRGGTTPLDNNIMFGWDDLVFNGSGLEDMSVGEAYTGADVTTYVVRIDSTGTPDTFKWMRTGESWHNGIAITGAAQTLDRGFTITFAATTSHTLNDQWSQAIVGSAVMGLFDFVLANENEFIVRGTKHGQIWKDDTTELDIYKVGAVEFTGAGLDDLSAGGSCSAGAAVSFKVQIDGIDGIKESNAQGSNLGKIKTSALCNSGIKTSSLSSGGIKTSEKCDSGIIFANLASGGTDYGKNDGITVDGGSVLAKLKLDRVDALGQVYEFSVLTPGAGYSVAAGVATSVLSGMGAGLTINITGLGSGGSGYAVDDTFTINGGTTLATGKVLSVTGGVVTTYEILTPGAGYSVGSAVGTTRTSGSGYGFMVNILTLHAGGSGYLVGDTFTVNGGSSLATGKVLAVSEGKVTSYEILTPGAGYSVADNIATTATSGSGTGFAINIVSLSGAGGSGYAANDTFTIDGGSTLATGKVLTVSAGVVVTYSITDSGEGYSVKTGVGTTATSGAGTDLEIDILTLSGGSGSGYAVDDTFTVDGGSTLAEGKVLTISSGKVSTYEITSPGAGYSVANGFDTTAVVGQGSGLEIDITEIADTVKWSTDGGANWTKEQVLVTTGFQVLENQFKIKFGALVGHTVTEYWTIGVASGSWTHDKIIDIVQSGDTIFLCNGADLPVTWNGSDAAVVGFENVPADWSGTNYPKQIVLHGRLNSLRGWAIGCPDNPKTLYVSANGTPTDFTQETVLVFNIETGDGAGIVAGIEFGDRILLFGKRRSFVMDDADYNTDNWGYFPSSWVGGVAHQRLLVRTPNDLVAMTDDGEIYSVTAAEQYGDYKAASLSRPSYMHDWIKQYLDLEYISDFHAIYDPSIRAIKFFVVRTGSSTIDTCLCYYIDRPPNKAWVILDNQDHESGYSAASAAWHRQSTGLSKIYTGSYNGQVWKLGETSRTDNYESFKMVYRIPPTVFGDARILKRYDHARFIALYHSGGCECTIKWWIDGVLQATETVDFVPTLGDGKITEKAIRLGRLGKRIQIEITNDIAGDDCYLSQIMVDFTVIGKTLYKTPPMPPV